MSTNPALFFATVSALGGNAAVPSQQTSSVPVNTTQPLWNNVSSVSSAGASTNTAEAVKQLLMRPTLEGIYQPQQQPPTGMVPPPPTVSASAPTSASPCQPAYVPPPASDTYDPNSVQGQQTMMMPASPPVVVR